MGKRLSDGEESRNIRELSNFRSYWRDSPDYPDENRGNNVVKMPVAVSYEHPGARTPVAFVTEFVAFVGSGPSDGTVDLAETGKIKITKYHLRFEPAWQSFSYDNVDHSLVITAISDKMGGRYRVVISPMLTEP